MSVPDWVQDAIFYQIFPDRFENGDNSNDPPNVVPWGQKPTRFSFHGGDLRGIQQRLDHLEALSINAIYLNPIFQSPSTHRYNATDYYQIDNKLGDQSDWRALVDAAHARGMRIILDGVFNHCGRGFFAFNDILENGEYSPYRNWFHIRRFPVNAYSPGEARDYLGWWNHKSLPKFNTDNPHVRRYLLDVARYWIDQGADGWRLDVPNEIDDDSFWAEFRRVVRAANPEAYLLGEIWHVVPRWVSDDHFDGLMNYPVRAAVLELLTEQIKADAFLGRVEHLLTVYPVQHVYAQFNTLGTHDTERVITRLGDSVDKVKLAFAFLFAYPGAPSIYYGDEVGLEGGKDPDCRRAFPWERSEWKEGLFEWVRRLSRLRSGSAALRRGSMRAVYASESLNCCAFARSTGDEHILAALNASDTTRTLRLRVDELGWQDGQACENLLAGEHYTVSAGHIELQLPPYGSAWLARRSL